MNYEEFKQKLLEGEVMPDYYEQLLLFSTQILTDIALTSRHEVAKALQLNYQKLSHLVPLLKAYTKLTTTL